MKTAIEQANKAFLSGEVPVGAVIVKNGEADMAEPTDIYRIEKKK